MEVRVRHKSEMHALHLTTNSTVGHLMTQINRQIHVPPREQRLIFQGKTLSDKKDRLIDKHIVDGSKILLVVSPVVKDGARASKRMPRPFARRQWRRSRLVQDDELYLPPHAEFVMRGPPAGCMPGGRTPVGRFPTTPLVVYDTSGEIARMSFETDAIWVANEGGGQERIFLTEIDMPQFVDIPDYRDQYIAVFISMDTGRRVFYFIPKQFQDLIEGYMERRRELPPDP